MMTKDKESPNKDNKNYKSNDRKKFEHIDNNDSLSESY